MIFDVSDKLNFFAVSREKILVLDDVNKRVVGEIITNLTDWHFIPRPNYAFGEKPSFIITRYMRTRGDIKNET